MNVSMMGPCVEAMINLQSKATSLAPTKKQAFLETHIAQPAQSLAVLRCKRQAMAVVCSASQGSTAVRAEEIDGQQLANADTPEQAVETVRSIPPQRTLLEDASEEAGPSSRDGRAGTDAGTQRTGSNHVNNYQPQNPRKPGPRYNGTKSNRRRNDFALDWLTPKWPNRRHGEIFDFPFQKGDTVTGTIVGGMNGWRVALDYDPEIVGYCSTNELPHILKDEYRQHANFGDTILGTRRNFIILDVPTPMFYNGRGPLLSARQPDTGIIWQRAHQMKEICQEEGDVISVRIATSNNGGVLGFMDGLPLFVPWSYLPRLNLQSASKEDLIKEYVGKNVIVSVQDVSQEHNRFVGNMLEASKNNAYSRLKIGDLVWGTVNSVATYGAFVTMDDFQAVRALVHVANISQNHVNQVKDVFAVNDRVRAAVIGIDQEAKQLSLSTAELELEPGAMLRDKEGCYETAEDGIKDYLAFVQEQREAGYPEDDRRSGSRRRSEKADSLEW